MTTPDVEAFWSEAWGLLDDDRPQAALSLARRWIADHPELSEPHYVAGVAAGDLDDPEGSLESHAQAAVLAPEWDEAVVMHVAALHRLCRFSEAREILETLSDDPPEIGLHRHLVGLLAERAGDDAAAGRAFAAAAELDPDTYADPVRLTEAEFEQEMEAALGRLPATFRDALDNIAIVLEPVPDEATLAASSPPHDPELLGLYVGTPLRERSVEASGQGPDVIHLFQRNLERSAGSREDLEREIAVTLYHEIAHALGFEEEDMPAMGLD